MTDERETRDMRDDGDMGMAGEARTAEDTRARDMRANDMRGDGARRDDMRTGEMRTGEMPTDDMRSRDMRDANAVRSDEMPASRGMESDRMTTHGMWPDMADLRQRFDAIQSEFIDDPREAVKKAEALMGEIVDRITRSMHDRVESMHKNVDGKADTEQLRLTMRSYRDLVDWMESRRAA